MPLSATNLATSRMIDDVAAAAGVEVVRVTLHVGPGTFRPITAPRLEEHRMDAERYAIGPETAAAIAGARDAGRPVSILRSLAAPRDGAATGGPR